MFYLVTCKSHETSVGHFSFRILRALVLVDERKQLVYQKSLIGSLGESGQQLDGRFPDVEDLESLHVIDNL